ncbi:outer membrane protein assembly factor BamE [Shewanella schlegeliana]|uniref:Outer membrane protein assembly factor BamE n=1 Tax=Shewanella schlegeliana TaxID=190308 RepID=A0ABS1SZY6_9GAMM|nr:outer membrane protein assembly factor BamE [Shewanella schlegeliana]MBL4914097.1 outer membrane protein assembly factor BamE [Shewanella schlegeliana]MCL1110866.1 outer membrane protein assembly factor BamE [Shewanella schlegeliana]GIU38701.1 outer membrane protein assembly factor BamE [Shewanella schlegeliana]
MTIKKKSLTLLGAAALSLSLSGCGVFDWLIYKPDIPQGNYMEKQQVEKLRIDMTKEQVEYVLGRPVLRDSFSDDTWYYVYHYKSGRDASIIHKELIINFNGDKLVEVKGDYELSPEFSTPLEESKLPEINTPEADPLIPEQRPQAEPLVEEKETQPETLSEKFE